MGRYVLSENDYEVLMDSEHPGYPDADDAIVCIVAYDCPEDNTFYRNLNSIWFLLNEQDARIKELEGNG